MIQAYREWEEQIGRQMLALRRKEFKGGRVKMPPCDAERFSKSNMPLNGYEVLGLLRHEKIATAKQLSEQTHLTQKEIAYSLMALARFKLVEKLTLERGGWVFAYIGEDADDE